MVVVLIRTCPAAHTDMPGRSGTVQACFSYDLQCHFSTLPWMNNPESNIMECSGWVGWSGGQCGSWGGKTKGMRRGKFECVVSVFGEHSTCSLI